MASSLLDIAPLAIPIHWDSLPTAGKLASAVAGICAALLAWRLAIVIYRLTLHPLAKFPGPKQNAATNFFYLYHSELKGTMGQKSVELHKKYGPVVRIAPDILALDGSVAWPQVFQHQPGKPEWSKQKDFNHEGDRASLIGSYPLDEHKRQRRQLGHAFSTEAMYEQEVILQRHIDMLMDQLTKKAAAGEAANMVQMFNISTFDIVGDLMFGVGINNLEKGEYHPWVSGLFQGLEGMGVMRFLRHYSFLKPLVRLSPTLQRKLADDEGLRSWPRDMALARMAQGESPDGRRDFMTYMLRKNRDGQSFSETDITMNAPTLMIAGSETSATTMSAAVYFLGLEKHRHCYETVTREVRAAFRSESDIDMKAVSRLKSTGLLYLNAVINETLRLFPPVPVVPPRVSPGGPDAKINGVLIPQGSSVIVYNIATYRNESNFHDPLGFRPERWLPKTHPLYSPVFDNDNQDAFKPFSYGLRDCIGKNLAYSEIRITLSRFMFRYDFELGPGTENWMDTRILGLWERMPLPVFLKQRK